MLLLSAGKNLGIVPANTMYGSVLHFAPDFRGGTDKGETILQTGGVVAVSNTGGYQMVLAAAPTFCCTTSRAVPMFSSPKAMFW